MAFPIRISPRREKGYSEDKKTSEFIATWPLAGGGRLLQATALNRSHDQMAATQSTRVQSSFVNDSTAYTRQMGTDHVESKSECAEDTFEGSFAFVEGECGDNEMSRDIDLHE